MTVAELIQKLQEFPYDPNAEIVLIGNSVDITDGVYDVMYDTLELYNSESGNKIELLLSNAKAEGYE